MAYNNATDRENVINNIRDPDIVRFSPKNLPYKVWRETIKQEHYLNYESVWYQKNGYKLNLIDQHYKGTVTDETNVSKHIVTPCKGEGERFFMRVHNSSRLYKPLFKRQVEELHGRIMNNIAVQEFDEVVEEDWGIIDTMPSLKNFREQAGGVDVTYKNMRSQLVSNLIGYGQYYILVHPKMVSEADNEDIHPPKIELVNPLEIINYGDDFIVRRKLMTKWSNKPDEKPELYVQYWVYYSDRVEHWKMREDPATNEKEFILESPQPDYYDHVHYYYEDQRDFTNVMGQPCLPIWKASLELDSGYAYNMAAQNSYIFDSASRLYYLSVEITSPRIKYDATNKLTGDLDSELRDELTEAEIADLGFIPNGAAGYIIPDAKGFNEFQAYMKKLEVDFKLAYFLQVDDKAIQKSAPQSVEESKAIQSFETIVLDKLGDAETRILESIVELESPGNTSQKEEVYIKYKSAYDKLSDRKAQENKEEKAIERLEKAKNGEQPDDEEDYVRDRDANDKGGN